jgi:CRISPR-associated endonuclease/helicase Cas3
LALTEISTIRARMDRAVDGPLSAMEVERLGVLVFLHDIGKLFPSFQAKGWPEGTWSGDRSGHVLEALDVLCSLPDPSIAKALHVSRIAEWEAGTGLVSAILAHHGRPVCQSDWNFDPRPKCNVDPRVEAGFVR